MKVRYENGVVAEIEGTAEECAAFERGRWWAPGVTPALPPLAPGTSAPTPFWVGPHITWTTQPGPNRGEIQIVGTGTETVEQKPVFSLTTNPPSFGLSVCGGMGQNFQG